MSPTRRLSRSCASRCAPAKGKLLVGTYRSIWAAPEVEASPALAFLTPRQRVELAPADAEALELRHGEAVVVSDGEREVRARVALRAAAPAGTAFLERELDADGANVLPGRTRRSAGGQRRGGGGGPARRGAARRAAETSCSRKQKRSR